MQQNNFSENLAELRRQKGVTQREAARELQISQALLSHYENGAREPGLAFVCRACDYYGVTADYLLGRAGADERRTPGREAITRLAASLRGLTEEVESYLR